MKNVYSQKSFKECFDEDEIFFSFAAVLACGGELAAQIRQSAREEVGGGGQGFSAGVPLELAVSLHPKLYL